MNFKTFLDGANLDELSIKTFQGKSFPGTSPENVFLEGNGMFVIKNKENKNIYTRLGEFTFDGEGVYKTKEGFSVQGYIINDNGEVLANPTPQKSDPNTATTIDGGPAGMATTDIKLWIDPSNGKYLGKYDEFDIKEDGIIYGKADNGKIQTPLYKIAIMNFNNQSGLIDLDKGYYAESDKSGKPVAGKGDIRKGLIEMSNADLKASIALLQQAKLQIDVSNKIVTQNKQLLQDALGLLQ